MSKRKPSPLAIWRAQYAYISRTISQMKQAERSNTKWGQYKIPRTQSLRVFMQQEARQMMVMRMVAQERAQRLWEANNTKGNDEMALTKEAAIRGSTGE